MAYATYTMLAAKYLRIYRSKAAATVEPRRTSVSYGSAFPRLASDLFVMLLFAAARKFLWQSTQNPCGVTYPNGSTASAGGALDVEFIAPTIGFETT